MGIFSSKTNTIWMIIIRIIRKFKKQLINLMKKIPVSNRYIMFESEIDYAENSRAIYDYMIEHGLNQHYHLIWSVNEPHKYTKHKNVVFIKRNSQSIRWNYYLNRCKFFIFTHPYWLKEWKENQCVINAWHGNPFKAPPSKKLSHVFDYILANSEDAERYRRKEFDGEFDVVILGPPRNDWLFEHGPFLDPFIGKKKFTKTIFFLPTYKKSKNWLDGEDDESFFISTITSEEELNEFNAFLYDNNVLLVCITHHLQVDSIYEKRKLSNILFLRDEDYAKYNYVMNQMLTCADALITDYSGVFIDFLLLNRPIAFLCNATEKYSRGFAMDNPQDYMAGKKLFTTSDIKDFIISLIINTDDYKEQRETVKNLCHKYQDANNCERFLEYFSIIDKK